MAKEHVSTLKEDNVRNGMGGSDRLLVACYEQLKAERASYYILLHRERSRSEVLQEELAKSDTDCYHLERKIKSEKRKSKKTDATIKHLEKALKAKLKRKNT